VIYHDRQFQLDRHHFRFLRLDGKDSQCQPTSAGMNEDLFSTDSTEASR
jgi:hypothetical protein